MLLRPSLLEWIRQRHRRAEHTISICTGALLLAKAGLLDGLHATTHCDCLEELVALAPNTNVDATVRFTNNGQLLTSAGISAGIDVSLQVVAQLHGADVAENTARYMEYHWTNDGGLRR